MEILISLLIVSLVAGVSIPLYANTKKRGYLNTAQNDGKILFGIVQSSVEEYKTLGTTDGLITMNTSTNLLTIGLGVGAVPISAISVTLSKGTSASGKTFKNSKSWCLDVVNNGEHVIFNEKGYNPGTLNCPISGFKYPAISFLVGSDNQQFSPIGPFGGDGTRTFAVTSGSLPPGVTFDASTGVFSGPTAGAWNFTATRISVGGNYSCAVTSMSGVKCWGENASGQLGDGSSISRSSPTNVYGLGSGVYSVFTSNTGTTCALLLIGSLKCWGLNSSGQIGDGTILNRYSPVNVTGLVSGVSSQVSLGSNFSCAVLLSGALKCWGSNNNGQLGNGTTNPSLIPLTVPGYSSGVSKVSAGGSTACLITNTVNALKCWGLSTDGQMGTGETTQSLTPILVPALDSDVSDVSVGTRSACAITSTGAVKCWGYNGTGILGNNSTTDSTVPVQVSGLTTGVASIDVGTTSACVITGSFGAKCWGGNANGQLGDGTLETRLTPVSVLGLTSGVNEISIGSSHGCAITTTYSIKCWGLNTSGQLGDGVVTQRTTAEPVADLIVGNGNVPAFNQTCAMTSLGGIKCWGNNGQGQLGNGNNNNQTTPTDVVGLTSGVLSVSTGNEFTCAVVTDGTVKCWGSNTKGQLGDGTTNNSLTPITVGGLSGNTIAITAGDGFACALQSQNNGNVMCWGDNSKGQLGNGTTTDSLSPVQVTGLGSGVASVNAGFGSTTCATMDTGGLKCWGLNSNGQLGDGTTIQRLTPVDVSGLTSGVTSFDVGPSTACAVTSTGALKCWGFNGNGQLGNNTTTQSLVPINVTGLSTGVAEVTVGYYHTCAKLVDTSIKCWGFNGYGQVGDGTITQRLTPVTVIINGTTTGVERVSAGQYHTCAVLTVGTAYCWGLDTSGQLGLGTQTQQIIAVPTNYTGAQAGFPTLLVVTVTDSTGSASVNVTLTTRG